MAQMIPDEVRSSTSSNAERRLFSKFRDELSAQWTVFHSLGLASHRKKFWGEADFVAVGPHGVFCLEIKGGRVRREAGMWIFTNRDGEENSKAEGPFEQAKDASYALKNYLREQIPSLYSATFGWGVMMPDIRFQVEGPDISPEIVFDERDMNASLSRYVRRLGEHWHGQHEQKTGYEARFLDEAERREIAQALRGDFDLRPTLRSRVEGSEAELIQLTHEQRAVLNALQENPRLLVQGGAGTGKTLLAVEEARRHCANGKRVLLTCYRRPLGEHLAAATKDFGPDAQIWAGHLPLLMEQLALRANLGARFLVDAEERDIWDVFLPEAAFEAILQLGEEGCFDVVILDEAQDFGLKHFDVLDALLAGGWQSGTHATFCDPFQIPFRQGATQIMQKWASPSPTHCKLTLNCRNTQPIAWAAGALSEVGTGDGAKASGEAPLWLWTKGEADARAQITALLNRWLESGLAPQDIVVLSPLAFEQSLARTLTPKTAIRAASNEANHRFIRFASVEEFKGLEAKAVLLCDANDWDDERFSALCYVALTRPKSLLAVAFDASLKSEWAERFVTFTERWRQETPKQKTL